MAACPTEALTLKSSDILQFRQEAFQKKYEERLVVGCTRNPYVQPDITVECLAVLSTHDLVALILAIKVTELHLEYCTKCSRQRGVDSLRQKVGQVSGFMCSVAENGLILVGENRNLDSSDGQRRAFLKLCKKTVLEAVAMRREIGGRNISVQKRGSRSVPGRLEFLQKAIRQSKKNEERQAARRLFPLVKFADQCDNCGKCGAACPTGSLKYSREKCGQMRFEKTLCCGCGLCIEFCPVAAISISSTLY